MDNQKPLNEVNSKLWSAVIHHLQHLVAVKKQMLFHFSNDNHLVQRLLHVLYSLYYKNIVIAADIEEAIEEVKEIAEKAEAEAIYDVVPDSCDRILQVFSEVLNEAEAQ